jgi:hypothetical protein
VHNAAGQKIALRKLALLLAALSIATPKQAKEPNKSGGLKIILIRKFTHEGIYI